MSHNRHTSSRRKSKQSRKRSSVSQSTINYESLEERRLLAADLGWSVTSGAFGGSPDQTGGVGPNHVVQVTNGAFQVFDKTTGAEIVNKPLINFWTDTGQDANVGAQAMADVVVNPQNPRILYDHESRRWFITSHVSTIDIDIVSGDMAARTSPVLFAVSRTSNPLQDWQATRWQYDDDTNPMTQDAVEDFGFISAQESPGWTNLSVDADNVYVTVADPQITQTWAFNKDTALVVPTPDARAVSSVVNVESFASQVNVDAIGTAAGTFVLNTEGGAGDNTSIRLYEVTGRAGTPGLTAAINVPVDTFQNPPDVVRQEFDPDIINTQSEMRSVPVRHGNSLWATHSVMGTNGTSAIRWYEINLDTRTVNQSGTIQHDFDNYIYPSIAVTPAGHVVIGYTTTGIGPTPGSGKFPTASYSVGYNLNGTMEFEAPRNLVDGEAGYFDAIGNFWGAYMSTVADPTDPNKVFVFNQWSTAQSNRSNGRMQISEITLTGHDPTFLAPVQDVDNVIIVRRSALDPNEIEVEIDGIVVIAYPEDAMFSISVDGNGGNDTFILDTVNGELNLPGAVNFIGDGDDTILLDSPLDSNWDVERDGTGVVIVGTDLDPTCIEHTEDLVTFQLNFEEGSGWFDATPDVDRDGNASTRGDILRTELQRYFDEVLAPVFAGTFTVTIDINDDATDSLASSRYLGAGLVDVNGNIVEVGSPWSILTGRGDRNGPAIADGAIDYNLDLSLYNNNFQLLLDNIIGGLTRHEFFHVLGMESGIPNETATNDPRGATITPTVMDLQYFDLNGDLLVNANTVQGYVTNADWAGDNSGLSYLGIADDGSPLQLPVNSNSELIDFRHLASSFAGTGRDGAWEVVVEQDRAFLRGLGYNLNPVNPALPDTGNAVTFTGIDEVLGGTGVDHFCIRSVNVDLAVHGNIGNDQFVVNGVGVGALDLIGEAGDDYYEINISAASVVTVIDSVGTENDKLQVFGTMGGDLFVFDPTGVEVNAGRLLYTGIEDINFDAREGDDTFEITANNLGTVKLTGGDGTDLFRVNEGSTGNSNVLTISVNDPVADPTDELRLEIESIISDVYLGNQIENFQVDGTFEIKDLGFGTPTVAGGINLIGNGDETIDLNSMKDANWTINGDGSGTITMDVEPLTFTGVNEMLGSHGVDVFNIQGGDIDLIIRGREGNDVYNVTSGGTGTITIDDTSGTNIVNATGTVLDDLFVFDVAGVTINTTNLVYSGITNLVFDGIDGNDTFEVQAAKPEMISLIGGLGVDSFIVNDMGNGANANTLAISNTLIAGQIQLDIGSFITDTYLAETVEVLSVQGTYTLNGVNGTPAVAGGFTLTGDGDEKLIVQSSVDAAWVINGDDGDGTLTMDTDALIFNGLSEIDASQGIDTFDIQMDDAALIIRARGGDDVFGINNAGTGIVTISGDLGNDIFTVVNSGGGLDLRGDGGTDQFLINDAGTGAINATGGVGADDFVINAGATAGAINVTGHAGDDTFSVLGSGGTSLTVSGNDGNDTITFNDTGTAVSIINGDNGEDVFNILNSGTAGLTVNGLAGNDTFNINNVLGSAAIDVHGGNGNDQFTVTESGKGQLELFGEVGDDTYTVVTVDPTIVFRIVDSINAENDTLLAGGTNGDDVFDITDSTLIFNTSTWDVIGIENYGYDGLLGNDTFNVNMTNGWNGTLTLTGGEGNDRFIVNNAGAGRLDLAGSNGNDYYQIQFSSTTNVSIVDSAGVDSLMGLATNNADQLDLTSTTANINGGTLVHSGVDSVIYDALGGTDIFNVASAIGNSLFVGGDGVDTFNVSMTADGNRYTGDGGDDVYNIIDSGGVATFEGNDGVDTFNVMMTTGGGTFMGDAGNDIFNIVSATGTSNFLGGTGSDVFDVTDHLPLGSVGLINIDAGNSRNLLTVNGYNAVEHMVMVTSTMITGMSAVPIAYAATDGSFSIDGGSGGITLNGSSANDTFEVVSFDAKHTLKMLGMDGDDTFTIREPTLGAIEADGQEGSDRYQYAVGSANNRFLFALDSGTTGTDRLITTLTDTNDVVTLSGEVFVVDTDRMVFNENFEALIINSRGGDDHISINRLDVGFLRVLTGDGADTVDVNEFTGVASGVSINTGANNDTINLNTSSTTNFVTALGGDGDDSFTVASSAYGNAIIDGQEGSDSYDISIADRSSRFVVARDSGTAGIDNVIVQGTILDDILTLRSGVVKTPHQDILYNHNTESLTVNTGSARDNISIYGISAATTNVNTEADRDLLFLHSTFGNQPSKILNVDLGVGNDTAVIRGSNADTTTSFAGGEGDDAFNVGSSLADANGNLDVLYGAIDFKGNNGNDRIYMNDQGKNASFDYRVTATSVTQVTTKPNPFFAGITYDGSIETLRLDATNFKNRVDVFGSQDTAYSFLGSGGFNQIFLDATDASVDGRNLTKFNALNGLWTFTNGKRDIFFENFFVI